MKKTSRRKKFLPVGTLVEVEFLDHCQGIHRNEGWAPASCRAVGYVWKDEPEFLILSAWVSVKLSDDGSDFLTLVKHPGMKIRKLRGGKKLREMAG